MRIARHKNLFDEFDEQLNVITPLKKAAKIVFFVLAIIAIMALATLIAFHPDRHAVRFFMSTRSFDV